MFLIESCLKDLYCTFCCCCFSKYLPPLGDVPPEARLNLVIHHLRHNDMSEAMNLVKDLEPTSPQEYILKVIIRACFMF